MNVHFGLLVFYHDIDFTFLLALELKKKEKKKDLIQQWFALSGRCTASILSIVESYQSIRTVVDGYL
jgi:uncharacterized protein